MAGDAAQRVIAAGNLGRAEARETSGEHWQPPLLAEMLTDPYAAVRFVAAESLKKFPNYDDLEYDFLDPASVRELVKQQIQARWQASRKSAGGRRELLQTPDGRLDRARLEQLIRDRDNRPLMLIE